MALQLTRTTQTLFGMKELQARWDVSLFTIRNKIYAGEIRTVRFGTRLLVPREEVERIDKFGLDSPKAAKHDAETLEK